MGKLKAIWELTRLEHGIMFAIAVFIGALLTGRIVPQKLVLAMMVAILIEASTFSLNDYFDIEIDRKNKRFDRPLVRGDISPNVAIAIYAIFIPVGIALSFFINLACFVIALTTAILSTFYDAFLKKIKIIGNFYIAFTMAIPFIFGAAAMEGGNIAMPYFIATIAFLSGLAREIMKDVMDFEGDAEKNVKSFPYYIGKSLSNKIASILFVAASIIALIPFFFKIDPSYFHNYTYLSLVATTDFFLFYIATKIFGSVDIETLKKCRKLSLLALFIGLLAFLAGAMKKFFF
ncbi:MAG: UbiA family prenyltransferase [Thermoplasmata archaeon]|nr:UbiA family prenyltransferase [Thermoplasmata archaeon]